MCLSIESKNFGHVDYIIVGSGSGGSVLANRLSKNPSIKVLVLEAGAPPPLGSEVPFIHLSLLFTKFNWNFSSVPDYRIAHVLKDRKFGVSSGKVLGGTSMLNHNLFLRGNKYDYDDWAKNGATGWDWNSVFPYFLRIENNRNPGIVANGYHGVGGALYIQFPSFHTPITQGYIEAAEAIGYPFGDVNALPQTGIQF
ncbi:glucose dehydrogenase [FAD, quinone]-like [Centruroides vittatus]|uniref:glucose dehydrogenase [FAD, quinone]-like n=1 Tax=Centruroides vittatus TaxID=120091 RepID=UPI0035109B9E